MKWLIILLALLPILAYADVDLPRAATGFEVGVARLSDGHKALVGTSWVYHFEYQPDPLLSFFGQAGASRAIENNYEIKQTAFIGGIELGILPVLGLQIGAATTVNEIKKQASDEKHQELGPLTGLNIHYSSGICKIGTSATVLKTKSVQSLALRGFLLIEF